MDYSKHTEGQTSVKVHHQPGGQSSFSLAHDDGSGKDDRWGNSGKVGAGANQNTKPAGGQGGQGGGAPWGTQEEQKDDQPGG